MTAASSARPTSRSSPTPATVSGAGKKTSTTRCASCRPRMKWCRKAQELGTLDEDAARWMEQNGGVSSERQTQTGHRRQRISGFARDPPAGRRRRTKCGRWCAPAPTPVPSTTSTLTRFHGDVFDTATVREAMDGVDDVYYCVVDTRAWLRDTVAAVSHQRRGSAQRSRRRRQRARPAPVHLHQHLRDGGPPAWPRGDRGRRDRLPRAHALRAIPGAGRKPGDALRRRGRPARRRDVRLDDLRQRRLGRHPARRVHRRRGLRQAALPDERHPAGGRRRRRCRPGHDPGRRARPHRRALPRLRDG